MDRNAGFQRQGSQKEEEDETDKSVTLVSNLVSKRYNPNTCQCESCANSRVVWYNDHNNENTGKSLQINKKMKNIVNRYIWKMP